MMNTLLSDRRVLLPILLTSVVIAVGSVLIVAFSDNATSGASAATPAQSAAGAVTVDIVDFKYAPEALTVKAGTKVTWVNKDAAPHTSTARGEFDTGTLKKGEKKTLTLKQAGSYDYICEIHPFMTAKVTVT